MFPKTIALLQSGVGTAFPCAAAAVGVGHKVFFRRFFGQRQLEPTVLALTEDTLFDLASLSKLVSATMIALKFLEDGRLSLRDSIGMFLDYTGNYGKCEILHLMTHTSGLTPWLPLYTMDHESGDPLRTILDSEPCSPVGESVRYSCMGYLVLQRILETVGGEPLHILAEKQVFSPLGMTSACYNPEKCCPHHPIAATEQYSHTGQWATGHVHDENAYFLGGAAGNAGVFATLDDMIAFAGMCSARGIAKNGKIYLTKRVFDLAIENRTPDKAESRGLGFQIKGQQSSPMGDLMAEGSYGHTGFTGTSLYIDSETGLWGVLLTNSLHFGRDNRSAFYPLRRQFYNMITMEYKQLIEKGMEL